jgi:chaperonin GroES
MEPSRINKNIAEDLDEDTLTSIGQNAKRAYEEDWDTTEDWRDQVNEWLELATQKMDAKNWPWPNASNIKYPLVSTASMQFSARAYPTLVPSDGKIVKPVVIGKDPDGSKLKRAQKVATYMSWQLKYEIPCWEEEMDRLLMMTAMMGTMFKKTYYDRHLDTVCSKMVDSRDVTINYFAESVDTAERISYNVFLYERELEDRIRSGAFIDADLGPPNASAFENMNIKSDDEALPYFLVEQECWLNLHDDEYKAPYTVTFEKVTGKVLSIYPRFRPEDIITRDDKVVQVKGHTVYTKFGFIPNPESAIYDIGFGHLIGPLNESVNTLVNQLVDAGTLANMQAGFIGKGLRIPKGDMALRPGEWKAVNSIGDDIRKQLVPIPAKEPSQTLFNLLGTLVTSGKELASVAEIFVGKMPGQNTPATTTMATIEQGMKVFTAIYKRVYRSLEKEFKKIYRLNHIYLDSNVSVAVLDEPISPEDFDLKSYDICPGADPTAVSTTERLLKAQGLMELMPMFPGMLDPVQVLSRVLEAQEQPEWERLIPGLAETGQAQLPPPPPDPKLQEMQMKMEAEQGKAALKQEEMQRKMAMEERSAETKLQMEKEMTRAKLQGQAMKNNLDAQAAEHKQRIFMVEGAQKVGQKEAEHRQKLRQNEESSKSKPKSSGSGSKTK